MGDREQDPTVTTINEGGQAGGKIFSHPTYGQISAYRTTGGNGDCRAVGMDRCLT